MFILALLFIVIAYAVGSLNSAILVCKAMKLADPRSEGSGNPGATNVLRMAGKQAALFVLIADMLKGFLPVLIAHMIGITDSALGCVGLAAVVGHMYPVFFKFQGGKGVATTFGVILALSLWIGLLVAIVWAVVVFVTKYVSLASLISIVLALVFILFGYISYFLPVLVIAALVVFRHKENIERLRAGTENKITW